MLILPRDYAPEKHSAYISEKPHSVKEALEQFMEYFLDKANEKSLKQSVEDSSIIPVITRGLMVYFEKYVSKSVLIFSTDSDCSELWPQTFSTFKNVANTLSWTITIVAVQPRS